MHERAYQRYHYQHNCRDIVDHYAEVHLQFADAGYIAEVHPRESHLKNFIMVAIDLREQDNKRCDKRAEYDRSAEPIARSRQPLIEENQNGKIEQGQQPNTKSEYY